MSDIAIQFAVASSPFGAPTGWVPSGPARVSIPTPRATANGNYGNEAASQTYGDILEYTQDFVAAQTTTPTIPPTIGILLDTVILTSISISTNQTDFVKMVLVGHNHTNNAHANSLVQVAHGISISAGFGGIDFLGATAGSVAAVESSTLEISCGHEDVYNGDSSEHLAGNNHTAVMTASTVWHGVPTTAVGAAWDSVSVDTDEETTGFLKTTASGEKGLTLAAP